MTTGTISGEDNMNNTAILLLSDMTDNITIGTIDPSSLFFYFILPLTLWTKHSLGLFVIYLPQISASFLLPSTRIKIFGGLWFAVISSLSFIFLIDDDDDILVTDITVYNTNGLI